MYTFLQRWQEEKAQEALRRATELQVIRELLQLPKEVTILRFGQAQVRVGPSGVYTRRNNGLWLRHCNATYAHVQRFGLWWLCDHDGLLTGGVAYLYHENSVQVLP